MLALRRTEDVHWASPDASKAVSCIPPSGAWRDSPLVQNISREELKARLDRGDNIKLVMTMNQWQFEAEHIPGSIWVADKERAERFLDPKDEIVTYCSDRACSASRMAARLLEKAGYRHVWHYEGGLADWTTAGYPVEGTLVGSG